MVRARSLSVRLAAIWAILLALGGNLDLHFTVESASAAHGTVDRSHGRPSAEDVFVAAEPCEHGEARHVEEAERRLHHPCQLCLRNLENWGLEATLALQAVVVSAFPSRFYGQDRAPAVWSYSSNPVRGPPIA